MTAGRHVDQQAAEAYVMGFLDQREAGAVEAHLDACPDCRERVAAEARSEATMFEVAREARGRAPEHDLDLLVQAMPEEAERVATVEPDPGAGRPGLDRLIAWLFGGGRPTFGLLAAVAAAVVVISVIPRSPALPDYTARLDGGLHEVRSAETGPARLAAGAPFILTLRPERAVHEAVRVRLFVDGREVLADAPREHSDTGSVRIAATWPDLGLEPGPHDLLVVTGPASLDWTPTARDDGPAPPSRDLQVDRVPFLQVAPP